jgi:hypothetical protein
MAAADCMCRDDRILSLAIATSTLPTGIGPLALLASFSASEVTDRSDRWARK